MAWHGMIAVQLILMIMMTMLDWFNGSTPWFQVEKKKEIRNNVLYIHISYLLATHSAFYFSVLFIYFFYILLYYYK